MKRKTSITIVTCPRSAQGGVYYFVKSILPFIHGTPYVIYRGSISKGIVCKAMTLITSILSTIYACVVLKPTNAIVSSSLSKECLIRDGLLIRIMLLLRSNPVLIIHGFQKDALSNRWLLKETYFKARSIIVSSAVFGEMLKEAGYKGLVFRQYNPVEVNLLNRLSTKQLHSRILNILFLGRIEEKKGVFITLDMYKYYSKHNPNSRLFFVGHGSALPELKRRVMEKRIDGVSFHSYLLSSEKEQVLENSDVLILPTSHKEGLPIAIMEAMAAGLIVVSRPVGGIIDLYNQIDFGALTESLDPIEYTRILEDLVSENMILHRKERNRCFAKACFHPKAIVENIEEAIRRGEARR